MVTLCSGEDCDKNLNSAKSKSIICDCCNRWYCPDCSRCPKSIFNAIQAANKAKEDVSMIMYVCNYCKKITDTMSKIRKNVSEIKSVVDCIKTNIDINATEIKTHVDNKVIESVNEIKAEVVSREKSSV